MRWALLVSDVQSRVLDAAGHVLPRTEDGRSVSLRRQIDALLGAGAWCSLRLRWRHAVAGDHQSFTYTVAGTGEMFAIEVRPLRLRRGISGVVAVIRQLPPAVQVAPELERSQARLREAERMIGVGSWEMATQQPTITYSPGFARVLGLAPGAVLTVESYLAMLHPDDRATFGSVLDACVDGGAGACEQRIIRPDGAMRTLRFHGARVPGGRDGSVQLRGAVLDVTEQRELERERLAAFRLFEQGFDAAPIAMGLSDPRTGRYLRVNQAMCTLLGRDREELVQLGVGDITHPDDRAADDEVRRALIQGTCEVHTRDKRYIRSDGSVAWAEVHVVPVRSGTGTVDAFFAQKIDITERKEREARLRHLVGDAEWLGRIRDALDDDRLVLYWQPIVDLSTRETVQRELLLRMRDEDGTIIAPGQFLPIAERYGLISEIDRWVVRQAAHLSADGTPTEFNLSAASIGDTAVLSELAAAIAEAGVDPSLLVVEVTETAMIDQPDAGRRFVEQLRGLGCGIAIDDFGTGFASLKYLKHLAADHLKIDIEFVRDIARSPTDERLVRGIVGLAKDFNQVTIAEGIEDEETLAKLRELGVDRGQGYLFARPLPLDAGAPAPLSPSRRSAGCIDPLGAVRDAFRALAERDLTAAQRLCHPDIVLRAPETATRAGRVGSYRGHDGLKQYARDVQDVWDELRLTPTGFWQVNGAVVVLGRAVGRRDGDTHDADLLWVCRLCDGLILTIDAFQPPHISISGGCAVGERREVSRA